MSCPFCKAKETHVKTPFVTRTLSGKSEAQYTYCCKAQTRNNSYIQNRFSPLDGQVPSMKEVSKL